MSFKEVIRQVKNEYNIVDYIKANGVDLKASGNGTYKGLCPFHNEKTPSFSVSEDFQNYRCFGCDAQGDIISFAEKTHTINFVEAVKMLAEEKGIEIDSKMQEGSRHDITAIRKILEDARNFYRHHYNQLDDKHPAKQEIIKRGLNHNNELYGYAPEAPNALYTFLNKKGYKDKDIEDSTLVVFYEDGRAPWDFFHGRLLITLSDYLGRPISFTSRKIFEDDYMKAKYINGKESPIFLKKTNLFGADIAKKKARETGEIFVVEGQFDQISMWENGVENVVATSGTAFTEEHANLLMRMVGDSGKVTFIMDGDKAGVSSAVKIFTDTPSLHSNSYAVLLKKGKDPCDYIEAGGIELLNKAIKGRLTLYDFVIDVTVRRLGGKITSENRQQLVQEITRYAKHSNEQYIVDNMLNKASILSAISIDNVKSIYNKVDLNKRVVKQEKAKPAKLTPIVKIDLSNEGDLCMFSALSLLVRMPDELIPLTPNKINRKFKPFLRELGTIYKQTKESNSQWRFIAEDYSDSDFALALQKKKFLEDPKEELESSVSQYTYLIEQANTAYLREQRELEQARALSSIANSSDPVEIAKALKLYKESLNR